MISHPQLYPVIIQAHHLENAASFHFVLSSPWFLVKDRPLISQFDSTPGTNSKQKTSGKLIDHCTQQCTVSFWNFSKKVRHMDVTWTEYCGHDYKKLKLYCDSLYIAEQSSTSKPSVKTTMYSDPHCF